MASTRSGHHLGTPDVLDVNIIEWIRDALSLRAASTKAASSATPLSSDAFPAQVIFASNFHLEWHLVLVKEIEIGGAYFSSATATSTALPAAESGATAICGFRVRNMFLSVVRPDTSSRFGSRQIYVMCKRTEV